MAAARQTLLSTAPAQPASSAEVSLQHAVSTTSVQSAISAIGILHANLHSAYRIVSSTAVFVTFSAATVVIAASLVPELDVNFEDGDSHYGDMVAKAFQVLEEHQWQIEGARGARKQLVSFLETVRKARERRKGSEWTALGFVLIS